MSVTKSFHLFKILNHDKLIRCLETTKNGDIVTCGSEGQITLWKFAKSPQSTNYEKITPFQESIHGKNLVFGIYRIKNNIFSEKECFATTSFDKTAKIWDLSGKVHLCLNGHAKSVNCFVEMEENFFVTGSFDQFFGNHLNQI
ncbi:hypothetical protein MHBO_004464 [Bonamia ostreae]|uniref:Uncharacterized protein n=1 Tax=Bonamia ostreae TaxID=126728 RepID=A0ABV2ATD3_9EUKA